MPASPYSLRAPAPPGAHATADFAPRPDAPPRDESALSDSTVDQFWSERGLGGVIRHMEAREQWAIDGPQQTVRSLVTSREVIDVLVEAFSNPDGPRRLSECDRHVARFMAHLRTGRALALFRYLLERSPAAAIGIVRQGSECDPASPSMEARFMRLLYERVQVLERSRILARAFAPERIADLLEALDDTSAAAMID